MPYGLFSQVPSAGLVQRKQMCVDVSMSKHFKSKFTVTQNMKGRTRQD